MHAFLLDACAVIWIASGDQLREPAASELRLAQSHRFFVSPTTAWEIAMLVAKGKMELAISAQIWFDCFCELPGVELAEMPPSVLIASAQLPDAKFNDPVDRILVATAREFAYALATRDSQLLNYGRRGHVNVMAC